MATIKVKRKVNSDTAGSLSHGELGISQTKLWYGNQAGAAIEVAQKDLSLQVSTYPGAYNPVSGDILKYGAYGWGTLTLAEAGISASDHTHTLGYFSTASSSDLNTTLGTGQFSWGNTSTNTPVAGSYGQGLNIVSLGTAHNNTDNWITQLGFSTAQNTAYFRSKTNSGAWGSWYTFYHTGNKPTASDVGALPIDGKAADADLLDGIHAINLVPFGTISDFTNGTLVITDLDAAGWGGPSWTIEVVGKGYGQTPIKFIAEGYNYNDTFINTAGYNYGATTITYIKVLNYNNYLAFWWPRLGYWNSFAVTVTDTTSEAIRKNRVTSVINAVDPAVTKEVQINLVSFAVSTSSITIGSTAISLGSSATTIAGLTSVTSTTFVGALTGTASGNLTSASTLDASKLSGTIPATVAQSEWDSAYSATSAATSANTVSTIVKRDGSGNFSAGTITATQKIVDVRTLEDLDEYYELLPNQVTDTAISSHFGYVLNAGTSWRSILTLKGWTADYGAWQLIGPAASSADDDLYFRSGAASTWRTAVKIWHSGNLTNLNQLTNGPGYISGITSGMVTTALGFTPYNATNPAGYTTNTGTVTSIATSGSVSGITLTGGTITTSGTITLGGSISGLTTSNLSASAGITNGQLANSSITIGSSAVSLGGTLGTIAGLTSLTSATVVATTGLTTGSAGQTWVIDGSGTSLLLQSGATPTTRMTLTDGGVVTATTFVGALTGTASGNLIKSTYPGAWTEATGAITYFGGYGWSTLAPGTNGYVLKMSSGSPVWAAESSAYTLPTATSTVNGGIELFSDTVQATAANSVTSTASRTYGIQLNAAGQGVVNVPWTDKVLTDSNSVAYGFTSSWASTGLTLTLLANKNYKVSFYSNYTKNYSGTLNNIALELLFDSVAGTAPKISGYWYHAVTSAATAFTNSNTLYTAATTNAVGNRFVPAVNSNNVTNAPVGFEANISTGSANRVITLYAQCSGDNTGMTLTADASLTAVEL